MDKRVEWFQTTKELKGKADRSRFFFVRSLFGTQIVWQWKYIKGECKGPSIFVIPFPTFPNPYPSKRISYLSVIRYLPTYLLPKRFFSTKLKKEAYLLLSTPPSPHPLTHAPTIPPRDDPTLPHPIIQHPPYPSFISQDRTASSTIQYHWNTTKDKHDCEYLFRNGRLYGL